MFRDLLREHGFTARRGQQYAGGVDSPDVVCDELTDDFHFEVKFTERFNLRDSVEQANRDAQGKVAVVAHKRSHSPWLVTLSADEFLKLLSNQ